MSRVECLFIADCLHLRTAAHDDWKQIARMFGQPAENNTANTTVRLTTTYTPANCLLTFKWLDFICWFFTNDVFATLFGLPCLSAVCHWKLLVNFRKCLENLVIATSIVAVAWLLLFLDISKIKKMLPSSEYKWSEGLKTSLPSVLDAQTQNGDEPVGEITYPRAKLPF